jgi:ABC-type lipoprotein export system ATPase subunit
LRNHKLGFIFQFPSLVPSLTVLENVMLPTIFQPKADPMTAEDSAMELLNLVSLADRLNAFPRELSAGQQQRVVIARSLINQPAILLADEPTSNLDAATEREIMALLEGLHRRRAITVVMVTHTRHLATRSTRTLELAEGRLIHDSGQLGCQRPGLTAR